MQRDTVIFNFRKGFPALREAFEGIGYRVVENHWQPEPELLARSELCLRDANQPSKSKLPLRQKAVLERFARSLNLRWDGDTACFFLRQSMKKDLS